MLSACERRESFVHLLLALTLLTNCVGVDGHVLGIDVDLAALELARLDGDQQQVQLGVAELGNLHVVVCERWAWCAGVASITSIPPITSLNCIPTKVGDSVSARMTLLQAMK